MSQNTDFIPFTEAIERIQKLARVGDNTLTKIRGVYQDIYTREIPAKFDWNFLLVSSSFIATDEYHSGSLTMNTGDTAAIFSSDAVLSTAMVGRKLKPAGNQTVYDITVFSNTTNVTINPSLQGGQNLTSVSYSIFQPFYTLASNFDRFPKWGGIYRWSGGKKQVLPEDPIRNYLDENYSSTATTPQKCRIFGTDTLGSPVVELIPAPRQNAVYGYDYIRRLMPVYDTTAGTLSQLSAGGTIVLGNTNTRFTEALTDGTFFFRVDNLGKDQDSKWYRIIAISHDSQLTLATAFANTAITSSANYTISRAPEMPPRLHHAILYGTLRALTTDQNDPNMMMYQNLYAQAMSDAKKIYVSRPYSQEITGVFEDYRYRR